MKQISFDQYSDSPNFWEDLALDVGGIEVRDKDGQLMFSLQVIAWNSKATKLDVIRAKK